MTETIKAAFLPAAIDACALYRMFIPHMNIYHSKFLFRMGALDTSEIADCQVAIVQRQVSEHNMQAMKRMKEKGLRVIYDLDDNIWSLPSWNPGKQMYDSMQAGFKMCAAEADLITVSTRGLQKAAQKGFNLHKEIFIVPNSIDFNLFKPKRIAKDDGFTLIGWGGSNTHSEDCRDVFDIVCDVLDKNPHVKMEIAGAQALETVDKWENVIVDGRIMRRKTKIEVTSRIGLHERSRFRRWVPTGEYANRLPSWGWDLAIAPLADHVFNKSKSNIKMLEAAALGIPCLVSNIQPYNEFCSLGGQDLRWLLCDFPTQWRNKLTELVNDPARRKFLGEKMYDVAKQFYDAEVIAKTWGLAFKKALA